MVILHRISDSFEKVLLNVTQPFKQWTSIASEIGGLQAGYQIRISGLSRITIYENSDMEIDNIQLVNCEKINTFFVTTLNCTFENGTCGWMDLDLTSNSRLDWVNYVY